LLQVINKKRLKSDIGEEFYGLAKKIQKIIYAAQKYGEKQTGKRWFHYEYLAQYE
jgi:hypothetical protein